MPKHLRALFVRAGLAVALAAGVVGALVLGLIGLRAGAHGELERILALACIAMAAAGFLGLRTDDGLEDPAPPPVLGIGDKMVVAVAAPLILGCLAVFVATLVPAWYVIVPVFAALWTAIFGHRRGVTAPPPAARGHVEQPAYA